MKVHRVTMYVYGLNGHEDFENIQDLIDRCLTKYDYYPVFEGLETEEMDDDWSDDHPINLWDKQLDYLRKLFGGK